MKKQMTLSYQTRRGRHGDLPEAPKLIIANRLLEKYGFIIGTKVNVEYYKNQNIIKKLTQTL